MHNLVLLAAIAATVQAIPQPLVHLPFDAHLHNLGRLGGEGRIEEYVLRNMWPGRAPPSRAVSAAWPLAFFPVPAAAGGIIRAQAVRHAPGRQPQRLQIEELPNAYRLVIPCIEEWGMVEVGFAEAK